MLPKCSKCVGRSIAVAPRADGKEWWFCKLCSAWLIPFGHGFDSVLPEPVPEPEVLVYDRAADGKRFLRMVPKSFAEREKLERIKI